MNPFISYPDVKTKNSIEIIDLRHQSDHITPKKSQLFQEYNADPESARLFLTLRRRRQKELKSGGKNLNEVRVL